jgi:uncharacterized membrane protein (UPF0127 family)
VWLLRDDEVLATVEVAAARKDRRRGLLGRDGCEGALLVSGTGMVHTIGMRFAIDVAYCDRDMRVIAMSVMEPGRLARPRFRARHVIEAEAGAFGRWNLAVGDVLEVKE